MAVKMAATFKFFFTNAVSTIYVTPLLFSLMVYYLVFTKLLSTSTTLNILNVRKYKHVYAQLRYGFHELEIEKGR